MKQASKNLGKIFIVSGPSQVGKDSVVRSLWKHSSLNLAPIITFTSRAMRPGEKQGLDYNFVSDTEFKKLIKTKQVLEWARVRQAYFGTPKKPVLLAIKKGQNVLMQIDVQGGLQIKKLLPKHTILIFITAESIPEIKRRIFSSSRMTKTQKDSRWAEARRELKVLPKYHFVVVNKFGELDKTVNQVKKIVKNCLKTDSLD